MSRDIEEYRRKYYRKYCTVEYNKPIDYDIYVRENICRDFNFILKKTIKLIKKDGK